MSERVDINVPFAEKDEAKALGAWWDAVARTWYVPAGKDSRPFGKWLVRDSGDPADDETVSLLPPVFTVESHAGCWKCGTSVGVATLGARALADLDDDEDDDDERGLYLFSGISWLPTKALAAIRRVNAGYRKRFSKTASVEYFMNHCSCGAQLGDFFMYSEPGGAFFPMDEEAAARIKLRCLSKSDSVKLVGSAGSSWPDLVWDHAQRC